MLQENFGDPGKGKLVQPEAQVRERRVVVVGEGILGTRRQILPRLAPHTVDYLCLGAHGCQVRLTGHMPDSQDKN